MIVSKRRTSVDGQTYAGQRDPPGQASVYIAPGDVWKENYRLSTFRQFPTSSPVSPANLSNSGFYYTGYKDRVKCFSCGLCVENWMTGDNVAEKKWHRGDCDFANGRQTNNEPLLGLYKRHLALLQQNRQSSSPPTISTNMANTSSHVTISGGNFTQETLPASASVNSSQQQLPTATERSGSPSSGQESRERVYPCNHPVNAHMQSTVSRLESFKPRNGTRWPRERLRAGIDDLANAGFFYLGERDRVKCWYCNGGLQNWDYEDEPWVEHAKWFPSCEYLLRVKGSIFVENIVSQYPELNRPTPTVVHIPSSPSRGYDVPPSRGYDVPPSRGYDVPPSRGYNIPPSAPPTPDEAVDKAMTDLTYVKQARDMGFEEEPIKDLLKRKYETNGQFYSSSEEFLEALCAPQLQQSTQPAATNQPATPEQLIASAAGEPETSSSMLSQLKELEENRLCKVCRGDASNVVLIPCGHLASCQKCANGLKKCPICHKTIHDSIKTYRS